MILTTKYLWSTSFMLLWVWCSVLGLQAQVQYYDLKGNHLFDCPKEGGYGFHQGLAMVYQKTGYGWQGGEFAFINTKGKIVSETYAHLKDISEGFYAYKANNGFGQEAYGIMNSQGKMVTLPRFEKMGWFIKGYAFYEENKQRGIIDTTGKVIITAAYDKINANRYGGFTALRKDTLFFFDQQAKQTGHIKAQNEYALSVHNNRCKVKKAGLWGYTDARGQWVIQPAFTNAGNFGQAFTVVQNEKGYGVIDTSGNVLIPLIHSNENGCTNQSCWLEEKPGVWKQYDLKGNVLRTQNAKKVIATNTETPYIKQEGRCWYVNDNYEPLFDAEFEDCREFEDGFARVQKGNKWGLINSQGQLILPYQFKSTIFVSKADGIIRTEKEGLVKPTPPPVKESTFKSDLAAVGDQLITELKAKGMHVLYDRTYTTTGEKHNYYHPTIQPGKKYHIMLLIEEGREDWSLCTVYAKAGKVKSNEVGDPKTLKNKVVLLPPINLYNVKEKEQIKIVIYSNSGSQETHSRLLILEE